jgi:hypothetical protein
LLRKASRKAGKRLLASQQGMQLCAENFFSFASTASGERSKANLGVYLGVYLGYA